MYLNDELSLYYYLCIHLAFRPPRCTESFSFLFLVYHTVFVINHTHSETRFLVILSTHKHKNKYPSYSLLIKEEVRNNTHDVLLL